MSWLRDFWNRLLWGEETIDTRANHTGAGKEKHAPARAPVNSKRNIAPKPSALPSSVPVQAKMQGLSAQHQKGQQGAKQPRTAAPTGLTSAFLKKPDRNEVHVQVGLDFGTSSTKIVYRRLDDDRVFPLDFGHDLSEFSSFFLPSLVAMVPGKGLVFGIEAARTLGNSNLNRGLRNLKVILAGKHHPAHSDPISEKIFADNLGLLGIDQGFMAEEYVCSLFLAHVMHESRKRLIVAPVLKNTTPDFAWNVCLPIDHLENSDLWSIFQKVIACAEACFQDWPALERSNFKFESWKRHWDNADYGASGKMSYTRSSPEARVFVIPESVAQIAAYLASQEKERGLHALFDFGAGTTDVSIFSLGLDDRCYWFSAHNLPKGGHALESKIAGILAAGDRQLSVDLKAVNKILADLSRPSRNMTESLSFAKAVEALKDHLEDVFTLSKKVWGSASEKLKEENQWRNVRVFKAGGAANFRNLDHVFCRPVCYGWDKKGVKYPIGKVPMPKNYYSNVLAPFDRFSVAYGLSIPGPRLLDFVLPSDTPNQTPPTILVGPRGVYDGGYCPVPGRGWV